MRLAPIYLNDLGILCAIGRGQAEVARRLLDGDTSGMCETDRHSPGRSVTLGEVTGELPTLPTNDIRFKNRNNQLLLAALEQIRANVETALHGIAPERVGVIIGTSTSGISEAEVAMAYLQQHGELPAHFHYGQQELASPATFLATLLELHGPTYTISTACSSGAKALASAARLIRSGTCDVVLAGGVDTLCRFTIAGFSSLESVSETRCNPFSANRKGINIGEGAALFLVSRKKSSIQLCGAGESSDGHHISAPEPSGRGARIALEGALRQAGLAPDDIDYLNLHGTSTSQNDAMEARMVHDLFGENFPCSSTKALTGHTLGAAGAVEAGFCWLALSKHNPEQRLPPQIWDGVPDPTLPPIHLVKLGERAARLEHIMSSSFAFGGNNAALILGKKG